LAVLPAAQNRGICVRLLGLAEDHARSLGLSEFCLYTNEAMTENLVYYAGMLTSRPTGPSSTDSTGCSSVNPSTDHPIRGMSERRVPCPRGEGSGTGISPEGWESAWLA
jgi:hypothetical protein